MQIAGSPAIHVTRPAVSSTSLAQPTGPTSSFSNDSAMVASAISGTSHLARVAMARILAALDLVSSLESALSIG